MKPRAEHRLSKASQRPISEVIGRNENSTADVQGGIEGWELPQMFLPEQTQAATAQASAIEGWELPQMFLPEQTQAQYATAASGPR